MPTHAPRLLAALAFSLAAASAMAGPVPVLKFEGAIGVDPLTAAGGTDQLNVVRGINPGGRAWVIRKFSATVYDDGSITARGKGLLFSSGDTIATTIAPPPNGNPVSQVVATLACGPANNTAALYTSGSAPLNLAGNFNIQSVLRDSAGSEAPLMAVPCANPQLLIRSFGTAGPGGWFAVGILERDDD